MTDQNIILLTSAIRPAANVFRLSIVDPARRLFETYCSLLSWFRNPHVSRIVLCDNSNPGNVFEPIKRVAKSAGVELEVLLFQGDANTVSARGKGYGEGEILVHALEHSALLREEPTFFKMTGRQYVNNYSAIQRLHEADEVVFELHADDPDRLRTEFYKCSKSLYLSTLAKCHFAVRDRAGIYIEHLFRTALDSSNFTGFQETPILVGHQGTSGHVCRGGDYGASTQAGATALLNKIKL